MRISLAGALLGASVALCGASGDFTPHDAIVGKVTSLPIQGLSQYVATSQIAYDPVDDVTYVSIGSSVYQVFKDGSSSPYGFTAGVIGGLAFDTVNRDLYVSVADKCEIIYFTGNASPPRRFGPDWIPTLLAGGTCGTADGTGSAAQFLDPMGMVLDATHQVLSVADAISVREVTTTGVVTTLGTLGVGGYGFPYFGQPQGIALNPRNGELFVTDPYDNVIIKMAQTGVASWFSGRALSSGNNQSVGYAEDGKPGQALFDQPTGIVYDPWAGGLFVMDWGNHQVRHLDSRGDVTTVAGSGRPHVENGIGSEASFKSALALFIKPRSGKLLVADSQTIRSVETRGAEPTPPPHGVAMFTPATIPNGAYGIATASDGEIWFTEPLSGKLGRVLSSGRVAETTLPGGFFDPQAMLGGPDGNIWFDDCAYQAGGRFARLTPSGQISEFEVPFASWCGSDPPSVTTGADGNVWFADRAAGRIGSVTSVGTVTEFAVPGAVGIAGGPDGDLWVIVNGSELDRYTTGGVFVRRQRMSADLQPVTSLVLGSDARMWMTAGRGHVIVAVDGNGTIARYRLPEFGLCGRDCDRGSSHIVSGPDGALWFAQGGLAYDGSIGRMTTTGAYSEIAIPAPHSMPAELTFDLRNGLWFADTGAHRIGNVF